MGCRELRVGEHMEAPGGQSALKGYGSSNLRKKTWLPMIIALLVRNMGKRDLWLKRGQSCGTEPFNLWVCANFWLIPELHKSLDTQFVSTENWRIEMWGNPICLVSRSTVSRETVSLQSQLEGGKKDIIIKRLYIYLHRKCKSVYK